VRPVVTQRDLVSRTARDVFVEAIS
jgi:hypothetical protein